MPRINILLHAALIVFPFSMGAIIAADDDITSVYQSPHDFLEEIFSQEVPEVQALWLSLPQRKEIESILGHPFQGFRIRYWARHQRSAWILDEVGKIKPITAGIVVENNRIVTLKVLIYRESHGWEIREDFFTRQFMEAGIDDRKNLDKPIDNISGATLSVSALKRMSRLALYLSTLIEPVSGTSHDE